MADWADRAVDLAVMPWDRLPASGAAVSDITVSADTDVEDLPGATRAPPGTTDSFSPFLVVDCHDFTLDAGVRLHFDDTNAFSVWIRATGVVTIHGLIDGSSEGAFQFQSNPAPLQSVGTSSRGGGGAHAGGASGADAANPSTGFQSAFLGNEPAWVPLSGFSSTAAGATVAITCRRLIIGSAGQITSGSDDSLTLGTGAGGPVGFLCDEFQNQRGSDAIVNQAGTVPSNAQRGSEGRRELYYRSASPSPPVIDGDWHTIVRWRAARRAWTVPPSDDVLA